MTKKFTKSLKEGTLAGIGVGLVVFIVMLITGTEYSIEWSIFLGSIVFFGYMLGDYFLGIRL